MENKSLNPALEAHGDANRAHWLGSIRRASVRALLGMVIVLFCLGLSGPALAALCEVPDAGGTAELPPYGCEYIANGAPMVILDGLPPGTTIELEPTYRDFVCDQNGSLLCSVPLPPGVCEVPGGALGGAANCTGATLELQVRGTGLLSGFNRTLSIPSFGEVHTAPRSPGSPVQDFDTEFFNLQGDLFGDPDFDSLQIRAGSAHGLPSPGHTTLTQKSDGNWQVESFFDVTYRIDFQGAPGSILEGLSGSTTATFELAAGTNPCDVVDNGTSTATLPPAGCEYITRGQGLEITNGLPPGATIELDSIHKNFVCGNQSGTCTVPLPPGTCEAPGGSLGGNVECFQSEFLLDIRGTGSLAGFSRTISMPMDVEAHTGPRNPGDPLQSFSSEMMRFQGQIFGDPDFCTLHIRAGDYLGLPSPGSKLLSDNGDGTFEVDSFFDLIYEIDFQGCPGSVLEGFGGTSTGAARLETGDPAEDTPPVAVPGLSLDSGWLWLMAALVAFPIAWLRNRDRDPDKVSL
jgi:hypothetical protein